jgi:DNA recombination protein RmuC
MKMTLAVIFAILFASTVGLITYQLTRRHAQLQTDAVTRELVEARTIFSMAKADFEARHEELRTSVVEARQRENDAKGNAKESDERARELANLLNLAVEEKGRLQNEAARIEETRAMITERERQLQSLHMRIEGLEREKTEALKDAEAANTRATEIIAKECEAQAEIVKAKDEQIAKLNEFIAQAREVLTTEFKAISADALNGATAQLIRTADGIIEKHGEKTDADVRLHQQHIETMLKPVEETIKRLDKHIEDSNLSRTRAEALLDGQMKRVAGASESLTNALRKPVVRGSWGEMTLENALESAGLQPEIDFVLQHTTDAEDGRKRTDAIINLPKGRKLIIDSKNLMDSYIALANAEDETQKFALAEIHSKSLKAHIKGLSAKEYWRRYEGLDCVILFIPHDGMYHAALRDEVELIRDASEKRVFVSNPMTLMPLLKAISYVLDQEKVNRSAEEISRVGAELYGEVTRFATNMSTIGDRLKSTVKAYNEAIPGLDRFIIAKSRKLKQLGSAKGAEAELPEPIEFETRQFSSQELKALNGRVGKDADVELVESALAT